MVGRSDRRSILAGWAFVAVALVWFAFVEWPRPCCELLPVAGLVACVGLAILALAIGADALSWLTAVFAKRRERKGLPPSRLGADFGMGEDWRYTLPQDEPYRACHRTEIAARGSPAAATCALQRNIGALVAGALGTLAMSTCSAAVCRTPCCHHIGSAKVALSTARSATLIWRSAHPTSSCPTVEQLKAEHVLDSGYNAKDAWGTPLELRCDGDEISGRSAGPDRRWGTEDDIFVPPRD
jgi:hypothetical protein